MELPDVLLILCVMPTLLLFILFTAPVVRLFTPSALFSEPRGGKAQAKRPEEYARSHRNCRHVYSLLAGTAAVAMDIT